MSVDLIARALAVDTPIAASTEGITNLRLAASVDFIQTSGYSISGKGAGFYVNDSLATAALALAHPRFCKRSLDGRYWRLLPDVGGSIAVEQGGAIGDGATNDLPACRAALAYAKAVGIWRIHFFSPAYRWWAATVDPVRPLGCFLVVEQGMHLEGRAPKTLIELRGHSGGPLETELQTYLGNPWRGAAILVAGTAIGAPLANPALAFSAKNLKIDGGAVTSRNNSLTEGSHKGLAISDTVVGSIVLDHVELRNFKAEIYYNAAYLALDQWLRHCIFDGSNQSAFNAGRGRFWVDQCEFGNAYLAAEVGGTIGGRIQGTRFHNSVAAAFYGGSLSTYVVGGATTLTYNYSYPDRDTAKAPPWLDLDDCDFHNCGTIKVNNFVRIKARATDTGFMLTASSSGRLTSTYLDIESTIDQIALSELVYLQGPPTLTTLIPGAPAGNYILPPDDVRIRIRAYRTAVAVAANRRAATGVRLEGYLDHRSNTVHFDSGADSVVHVTQWSAPNQGMPMVEVAPGQYTVSLMAGALGAFPITVSTPYVGLYYYGAAGDIDVTIASPFSGGFSYAWGQKVRVNYGSELTAGTVLRFAKDGAGLRLSADRNLRNTGDWLELEFNEATGRWHEVRFHMQKALLTGTATYDAPSIAAGGTATTTVPVTGAALGDRVDGVSFGVSLAGLVASAYVSAADTVTVVLFNPTGAAVDLASSTVKVEVTR